MKKNYQPIPADIWIEGNKAKHTKGTADAAANFLAEKKNLEQRNSTTNGPKALQNGPNVSPNLPQKEVCRQSVLISSFSEAAHDQRIY